MLCTEKTLKAIITHEVWVGIECRYNYQCNTVQQSMLAYFFMSSGLEVG